VGVAHLGETVSFKAAPAKRGISGQDASRHRKGFAVFGRDRRGVDLRGGAVVRPVGQVFHIIKRQQSGMAKHLMRREWRGLARKALSRAKA